MSGQREECQAHSEWFCCVQYRPSLVEDLLLKDSQRSQSPLQYGQVIFVPDVQVTIPGKNTLPQEVQRLLSLLTDCLSISIKFHFQDIYTTRSIQIFKFTNSMPVPLMKF